MHTASTVRPATRPPGDQVRFSVAFTSPPQGGSGAKGETLVITDARLFILDPKGTRRNQFLLGDIQGFRITPVFGASLFQIRVDGVWLDLLTFRNQFRDTFERLVRLVSEPERGEAPEDVALHGPQSQRCQHCGLQLAFPGEPCPRCRRPGQAFRRALELIQPYWKSTALLTLLLFGGVALDMVWPLLTRYLVDHVLTAAPAHTGRSPLLPVVLGLVGVQVCRAGVSVLTNRIGGYIGNALTFDLRSRLVSKMGRVGLAFHHQQPVGSLVSKIMYDTESIYGFINQLTAGFLMQIVLVVCSLVLMFSLAPRLAWLALSPAPFIIAGAYVYWRIIYPMFQRYLERVSQQAGLLSGTLGGIKVVKVFGQEKREYARFQQSATQLRNTRTRLDRTNSYFHPVMSVVFQAGGWLIWYLGGQAVLEGTVTLGTLVAFFGYMSMFYGPLGSLTTLTTWVTQFSVQIHRLSEILDTPVEDETSTRRGTMEAPAPVVQFREVTFGYARGAPVLKKMSFTLHEGEHVGIIGRNGSGKTSIANALGRLYSITSGQILLRGVDLRNLSKNQLRSELGLVLQECCLFRGSLLDNVTYGKPDARLERVLQATRAVNAHDFIISRPLAYDSSLGEGGQGLSGGERQKINIARALLCTPRILVLDEATSQVDSESGLIIHHSARRWMKGRTTLTIAHRLHEIADCDRVMVLEGGRILEFGPPGDLLTQNGPYAAWVRGQQANHHSDALGKEPPGPSDDEAQDVASQGRWIQPAAARFDRGAHGDLRLRLEHWHTFGGVFVVPCFPVTHPEEYLSVRYLNAENRTLEIGLIADLSQWPGSQVALIRQSLQSRCCLHIVKRIRFIRRADQLLFVVVATETGWTGELLVRSAPEYIQEYGPCGCLLTDTEEDLYLIPDVGVLPRSDQALLYRYAYWFPDLLSASANSPSGKWTSSGS